MSVCIRKNIPTEISHVTDSLETMFCWRTPLYTFFRPGRLISRTVLSLNHESTILLRSMLVQAIVWMWVQLRIYTTSDIWNFSQNYLSPAQASAIWKNFQTSRAVWMLNSSTFHMISPDLLYDCKNDECAPVNFHCSAN